MGVQIFGPVAPGAPEIGPVERRVCGNRACRVRARREIRRNGRAGRRRRRSGEIGRASGRWRGGPLRVAVPRDDVFLLPGSANEAEVHTAAAVEDDSQAEELENDDAGEDDEQAVEQQTEDAAQHGI